MGAREGHRPLARGTRRRRTNEMNLIQTLEAEAIEQFQSTKDDPRIPSGRHAARRRQGRRGRAHPHPEFRRRLHRPLQPRPGQLLHGPQDQLRRGRRARLPALLAERRFDRGRPPRRRSPRQALLSARPHRQVGPHRRAPRHPSSRRRQGRKGRRRSGERRELSSPAERNREGRSPRRPPFFLACAKRHARQSSESWNPALSSRAFAKAGRFQPALE